MRLLKPLLAGATLLTLAVPALAAAEPYFGDRGGDYGYSRDYGYGRDYGGRDYGDRDDGDRSDFGRGYDHRGGWRYRHYFRRHHRDWRYEHRWDERGWR